MRSRGFSILTCVLTVLCPFLCTAELAAHQRQHGQDAATEWESADHEHCDRPQHQHDPAGDPIPHGDHACLCTASIMPGAAMQIPALAPAGIVASDPQFLNELSLLPFVRALRAFERADSPFSARIAPLLI